MARIGNKPRIANPPVSESSRGRGRIAVALSGGVDSAVAVLLLQEQGFEVVGVHIVCWKDDARVVDEIGQARSVCTAAQDAQDARRVAGELGIPFYVIDGIEAYRTRVYERMMAEFAAGRTPNPDIWCNEEIKFGFLLDQIRTFGFDRMATGHYARIINNSCASGTPRGVTSRDTVHLDPTNIDHSRLGAPKSSPRSLVSQLIFRLGSSLSRRGNHPSTRRTDRPYALTPKPYTLARARARENDQTYFLYRVESEKLVHVVFPLGEVESKEWVRAKARATGLSVADRDSTVGICLVGDYRMDEFVPPRVGVGPGKIVTETGTVVGEHKGAVAYTLGQRAPAGGPGPWFVIKVDPKTNTVVVSQDVNHPALWSDHCELTDVVFGHCEEPAGDVAISTHIHLSAVPRYQSEPIQCTVTFSVIPALDVARGQAPAGIHDLVTAHVTFLHPIRCLTPGQHMVFYDNDRVVGGGIIS